MSGLNQTHNTIPMFSHECPKFIPLSLSSVKDINNNRELKACS